MDIVKTLAQEFNIKNIESLLKSSEPVLINIIFEQKTEVEPRVLFGNSINNPEPRISNCEVE